MKDLYSRKSFLRVARFSPTIFPSPWSFSISNFYPKIIYPLVFSPICLDFLTLAGIIREKNAENVSFFIQLVTNHYDFDKQGPFPL